MKRRIERRISGTCWRAVIGLLTVATVLLWAGKPAQAQQAPTFSVLYTFTGGTDGGVPYQRDPLVLDKNGNLYGTTTLGGDLGASQCFGYGCGVVFRISPAGEETVLYSFTGATDGGDPEAGLVQDKEGNLYGTTAGGGASGGGVVFRVQPDGNETVLYSFPFVGPEGDSPVAGVVRDQEGNLYGTTPGGGDLSCGGGGGCGVVFKLDPAGNESVLNAFDGADGAAPGARLLRDEKGNLYGDTYSGGNDDCVTGDCGVVFEVSPTGKEKVLRAFSGSDGANPLADLVYDQSGNLYGTTFFGGSCSQEGCGVVFKLTPTGEYTLLYDFTGGEDERFPSGLVRDKQGNLYGTTQGGGVSQYGSVFRLDPHGNLTTLYTFTGGTDGNGPYTGVVQDKEGNLYGMTNAGGNTSSTCPYGSEGCGVVFKITLR
jgi:uncharacterized repeat protein (TIGR03803 family)